jgi:uncharacterized small protein (DUF1192 family)
LPASNGHNENFVAVVSEVSERVSVLVREEIELAKAEVSVKAMSLVKGAIAGSIAAVFGVFALIFGLLALAWGLNSLLSSMWLGFIITFGVLVVLGGGLVMFAVRKLKIGAPPAPTMAIDEAKRIRATVSASTGSETAGLPAARTGATISAGAQERR